MSILRKLSDVLKEAFWIKPSRKKSSKGRKVEAKYARPVREKKSIKPKTIKNKKNHRGAVQPRRHEAKQARPLIDPHLTKVGEITHYFDRIKVGVVKVTQGTILIGDKLTIVHVGAGHVRLGESAGRRDFAVGEPSARRAQLVQFIQKVWSMQIESEDVKIAKKGQLIGLKIDKPVRVGDVVYK